MASQVGWKKQGSKCGKYLCFVWKSRLLPRAWRILSSGGGTRPVHLLSVALVSPGKERDQFGFALGKGKSLICWKHSYQNNRFKIKSENRNSVGKIKLQWTVLSPGWRPYKEAFFPPLPPFSPTTADSPLEKLNCPCGSSQLFEGYKDAFFLRAFLFHASSPTMQRCFGTARTVTINSAADS